MPNQTMVYSCSGAEQEYTMVWFGIFLYLLISSLKIRFCEQSVFAKSPLQRNPLPISLYRKSYFFFSQRDKEEVILLGHFNPKIQRLPKEKSGDIPFMHIFGNPTKLEKCCKKIIKSSSPIVINGSIKRGSQYRDFD